MEWRTPNPQRGPPRRQATARPDLVLWAQATEVWGVPRGEGQATAGPGTPRPQARGHPSAVSPKLPAGLCVPLTVGLAWCPWVPPFFSGLQVAPSSQHTSHSDSGHILRAQ